MDWISVKTKHPKRKQNVLCFSYFFKIKEIRIGHYCCHENSYWDENELPIDGVTHWMPLPKAPSA